MKNIVWFFSYIISSIKNFPETLETNYPELNKILNINGKLDKDGMTLVGAPLHSYKTGFMLDLAIMLIDKSYSRLHRLYRYLTNKPLPIIAIATFEDSEESLVDKLYCNIHDFLGKDLGGPTVDHSEACDFIVKWAKKRGYRLIITKFDPIRTQFTDLADYYKNRICLGQEIACVLVDNIRLAKKFVDMTERELYWELHNIGVETKCHCVFIDSLQVWRDYDRQVYTIKHMDFLNGHPYCLKPCTQVSMRLARDERFNTLYLSQHDGNPDPKHTPPMIELKFGKFGPKYH